MNIKNCISCIFSICVLTSCDPDSEKQQPLGEYENGFFVVNEGDMTNGTITFISSDGEDVLQDVFGAEHPGEHLGRFIQSMFFDGERAFIISNGSNIITVVNRNTFAYIGTIDTGLSVPRYGAVADGKAYVTNLNTFGSLTDDYVAVINLETLQVTESITMNALADRIISVNGNVYVSNGNYGSGSGITVINSENNTISDIIPTELGPNSMEAVNGKLYVMCGSYTDPSALMTVNLLNNEVLANVELPASMGNAQNLDIEGSKIYFTVNSNVYAVALNSTSITDTPLIESITQALYGFAVNDGKVYVADAKDYASAGSILVYSVNGTPVNEYTVGLIPNGVYFN